MLFLRYRLSHHKGRRHTPQPHAPPLARGWLKETVRGVYFRLLRTLRLTPYADVVALEERLRQERVAMQDSLSTWSDKATYAINRMWSWPDNAAIVCRKAE